MLKRILFWFVTAAVLLSAAGCTTYKGIYKKHTGRNERLVFNYLLYWTTPERLLEIIEQPSDKRYVSFNNEIKEIAGRLGISVIEFKQQQMKRIQDVNMKFGYLTRGMLSDKGRIWIKYGEPDSISEEQELDQYGLVEIWTYSEFSKKFYFSDEENRIPILLNAQEEDR